MRSVKLDFELPEVNHPYKKMSFTKTEKGKNMQTVGNLVIAIINPDYCKKDKILIGDIFFDTFRNEIRIRGRIASEKGIGESKVRSWDDILNNRLGIEIERKYKINYSKNKIWEAVFFVASQYEISPPKEYLKTLKWNKDTESIRKLLPHYLGAEDTDLNAWIMEHMLLGMVSRIFQPGSKFDEMMVLVGGQGIGKSTFAKVLAIDPDWYCSVDTIVGKDAIINLMGKSVVEVEEFVALRNAKSANDAKSFLSKPHDRARIPFDKMARDIPRTCIMIGTLNEITFLNDHTGERRYLPIECSIERRIAPVYYHPEEINGLTKEEYEEKVGEDFNQALAYAVHLYQTKNFDMNIPKDLLKELKTEQEKFKYINPDVEDLRYFLEEYKPRTKEPFITCYKEMSMAGYNIKSKAFTEIMENYFSEWKIVRCGKTTRIAPGGISIPVKQYYQKKEIPLDELPEEWIDEKEKTGEQLSMK